MPKLMLYFTPVTCARVAVIALEATGTPYDLTYINVAAGEHFKAPYLAINPKSKVPALTVDGRPVTELPAIILWLDATFPESDLLPKTSTALDRTDQISDLSYCAGTLHPIVSRLVRSHAFCDVPGGAESVYAFAAAGMKPNFAMIERRLAQAPWWYGDQWSMMDIYLNWVWYRTTSTPFDVAPYAAFGRHAKAVADLPCVRSGEQRMARQTAGQ